MGEEDLQLQRRVDRVRPDRDPLRSTHEDRRVVDAADRHRERRGGGGMARGRRRGAERRPRRIDAESGLRRVGSARSDRARRRVERPTRPALHQADARPGGGGGAQAAARDARAQAMDSRRRRGVDRRVRLGWANRQVRGGRPERGLGDRPEAVGRRLHPDGIEALPHHPPLEIHGERARVVAQQERHGQAVGVREARLVRGEAVDHVHVAAVGHRDAVVDRERHVADDVDSASAHLACHGGHLSRTSYHSARR